MKNDRSPMSKENIQITQKNGQFIFVLPSGALQHRQSCFLATHSVGVIPYCSLKHFAKYETFENPTE